MTLPELDGELIALVSPKGWRKVETVADASGVMFLCPRCFVENDGPVGTHAIIAWFADRGVPAEMKPGPGRWGATGTTLDDLTLTPSVNADNEHWHGFIRDGKTSKA